MVCLKPREGELTLRHDDVISYLEKEGESLALVLLPSVQYYTGQLFDMKTITQVAQKKVCLFYSMTAIDATVHRFTPSNSEPRLTPFKCQKASLKFTFLHLFILTFSVFSVNTPYSMERTVHTHFL